MLELTQDKTIVCLKDRSFTGIVASLTLRFIGNRVIHFTFYKHITQIQDWLSLVNKHYFISWSGGYFPCCLAPLSIYCLISDLHAPDFSEVCLAMRHDISYQYSHSYI